MPMLLTSSEIVAETSQRRGPCTWRNTAGHLDHGVRVINYERLVPIV